MKMFSKFWALDSSVWCVAPSMIALAGLQGGIQGDDSLSGPPFLPLCFPLLGQPVQPGEGEGAPRLPLQQQARPQLSARAAQACPGEPPLLLWWWRRGWASRSPPCATCAAPPTAGTPSPSSCPSRQPGIHPFAKNGS